jgi:flagellar motor switch protein FliN
MKSFAELSNLPLAVAFLNAFAEAFAAALEKVSDAKHTIELLPAESIEPDVLSAAENGLCLIFSAGGALAGEQAFYLSEADAKLLAQLLKTGTPDAVAPFTDADREAAAEALRQVAGQAAAGLTSKWSATVSLAFDAARGPAWEPFAKAAIRITAQEGKRLVLILAFEEKLVTALEEMPAAAKSAASLKESSKADPAQPPKDPTSSNLDLLLDIELEVTIRFGQREMLLRDILDLRSGSVIELERHVEEPAELLVAGRPVARGEVVVVEGNYGLRITEILSPRQRYDVVNK